MFANDEIQKVKSSLVDRKSLYIGLKNDLLIKDFQAIMNFDDNREIKNKELEAFFPYFFMNGYLTDDFGLYRLLNKVIKI